MSNRRKPRQQRRERRPAAAGNPLDGIEPWIWAIQDADEAERLGDAAGALAVMDRRPLDPHGGPFWRPSRRCWLEQLVLLAPHLPGWVRSRWILAQAHQHLDETDHARGRASRRQRALALCVELYGDLDGLEDDDSTDEVAVADFDWVHRQVLLYDLGALDAFLRRAATPDLVAGADRIGEWALAPMGGFTYLGAVGESLLWHDVATASFVKTLNCGSAGWLLPGAHVIGRLVPIEGGSMFESAPLEVPRAVADEVAADPARWIDVLRGAGEQLRDGTIVTMRREWVGVVSDVSIDHLTNLLAHRAAPLGIDTDHPHLLAAATLDLARCELEREAREDELAREEDHDGPDDEWDGWAHVHAALLLPEVVRALPSMIGGDDVGLLHDVRARVAEPARSWVGALVEGSRAAA